MTLPSDPFPARFTSHSDVPAIVEIIISFFEDSKEDLLKLSLVGHDWVDRSRYHLFHNFPCSALLDTISKIHTFSEIMASPSSTFFNRPFSELTISVKLDQLHPTKDYTNILNPIFQRTLVSNSVDINLDTFISPILWHGLHSWKGLSSLSIAAIIPSLKTLAMVIPALHQLNALNFDASFIDPTVPGLPADSVVLPCNFSSLHLGTRGYSLLSWLALYDCPIESLTLKIKAEDILPLRSYAIVNGGNLLYLDVTFFNDEKIEGKSPFHVNSVVSDAFGSPRFCILYAIDAIFA
ncbi:hypothetical protein H1R20_g15019, partial [Candolleomyces eurysporus]